MTLFLELFIIFIQVCSNFQALQCVPTGLAYQYWYVGERFDVRRTYDSCIHTDLFPGVAVQFFGVGTVTCALSALVSELF